MLLVCERTVLVASTSSQAISGTESSVFNRRSISSSRWLSGSISFEGGIPLGCAEADRSLSTYPDNSCLLRGGCLSIDPRNPKSNDRKGSPHLQRCESSLQAVPESRCVPPMRRRWMCLPSLGRRVPVSRGSGARSPVFFHLRLPSKDVPTTSTP